jgi:hypothetical protein
MIVKTTFNLEKLQYSTLSQGNEYTNLNINEGRVCNLKTCENKEICELDLFADKYKNHICLNSDSILVNSLNNRLI